MSKYYQEPITITLQSTDSNVLTPASTRRISQETQQVNAEGALQADPFFQQLQQEFSGELIKSSIVSIKVDL